MKKTVVLGASPNPDRFGYKAVKSLSSYGHPVWAVGIRQGEIGNIAIQRDFTGIENPDTVTLYLNPQRQQEWYQRILDLRPARVIFNPGTENPEFEKMLEKEGIKTEEACTLVLLSIKQY